MTAALHLLACTAGAPGRSQSVASPATVMTITSAPDGGWTGPQNPKAVEYAGYTYLTWINGSTGADRVAAYHKATGTLATPITVRIFGTDNHSSGAVLVESSSKRLILAYCEHDGATLYARRSASSLDDDPTLAAGFGPETNVRTSGDWTYPTMLQLDSGTVYLFYRYVSGPNGYLEYVTSTDGGATWSTATQIWRGTSGHVSYWRIISDGTKIHVLATDIEPGTGSAVYHFYMLGDGSLHKSDGTTLGSFITPPDVTLVRADANILGACIDGTGAPAAVLMNDLTSDSEVLTARYRAGAWQVDQVIASVGGIVSGNKYASGAAILPGNPNVVYLGRKSTKWELWRYASGNDGVTWAGTQITSASASDNVWMDVVYDAAVGPEAIWLYGTYTSDSSFSFGIKGYG